MQVRRDSSVLPWRLGRAGMEPVAGLTEDFIPTEHLLLSR